tara:strand:- start:42 stop:380 length:339 start_codon:yes stop_codon:yes gene_type:complete
MSEEQFRAFIDFANTDEAVHAELSAAIDSDANSIASVAQAAGFDVTVDDVNRAQEDLSDEQLSGEELEGIAGADSGCSTACVKRYYFSTSLIGGFERKKRFSLIGGGSRWNK